MLLLYFGTRTYLFSPNEGSCYVFLTRNNCCQFLAFYGTVIQSAIQSHLKTLVCGASLSYTSYFFRVTMIYETQIRCHKRTLNHQSILLFFECKAFSIPKNEFIFVKVVQSTSRK